MIDGSGEDRDLSVLVVPAVGAVEAGSDLWEPVRLIDGGGEPVVAVMAFLRELQASGRSAATQRSYAMDLLRWFRFGWAIDVGWDQVPSGAIATAPTLRFSRTPHTATDSSTRSRGTAETSTPSDT